MTAKKRSSRRKLRLPGDLGERWRVERIVRVDHAGEYGARRIYDGQLAVLGDTKEAEVIREMAEAEDRHLEAFEEEIRKRRARPTVLLPAWHVVGYALGAATALLGPKAAMACTEAVEEVIDGHYARQEEELDGMEEDLREQIASFRQEEIDHRDTARKHGAADAPGYRVLRRGVRAGTHAAIWLSERI